MKLSGQEQKKHGMDLVQDHNPDFVSLCKNYAHYYAGKHGAVSADEVRVWADNNDITPRHPNAWGVVFRSGFTKVGYRPSTNPASHGRIIAIWSNT